MIPCWHRMANNSSSTHLNTFVSSPWGEVQTNSAGSGFHTPERLQEITRDNPSSHCKVTVSPSVVPVVDTTLTLGDNTG